MGSQEEDAVSVIQNQAPWTMVPNHHEDAVWVKKRGQKFQSKMCLQLIKHGEQMNAPGLNANFNMCIMCI